MSLAARIRNGLGGRSSLMRTTWLRDSIEGGRTYSGKSVTVEHSLRLIPVYAAVNRLASAVGSSPLPVYDETGDTRERAVDSTQWRLLHDSPNSELAADEFWALVESHLTLWGNAFLFKERDRKGVIVGLWLINPSRVKVGRGDDGSRIFALDNDFDHAFGEDDILQIRGLSSDGLTGYSPIQIARQMLANSMAMEEFQGSFWKNSAMPQVVITHPTKLSNDALANLKRSWKAKYGGPSKAGETAILEEGMKVEPLTMPLDDAQFIDQARFNDTRIAQLFGLPPSVIAAKTGDSLTYATVEGNAIEFVRSAVRPWCVRIEQSLRRDPDIFPTAGIYPKFNLDALLRADIKTRYEAHEIGLRAGFLTVNEVRAHEDRNPIPGGNEISKPAPPEPPTPPEDNPDEQP